MAFLNCGRCGLEIKIQAAFLRVENCPRCLARSATVMPMVISTRRVTHAAGWGARGDVSGRSEAEDSGGGEHQT